MQSLPCYTKFNFFTFSDLSYINTITMRNTLITIFAFALSFFVFHNITKGQDTVSFKTYYENGFAKYKAKDYTGAIIDFNKAIEKKSDFSKVWFCIAIPEQAWDSSISITGFLSLLKVLITL